MANRSRKRESVRKIQEEKIIDNEDDLLEDEELDEEDTAAAKTIQTGYDNSRAAMMANAMNVMSSMNKDDLSNWLEQALSMANSKYLAKDIPDSAAAQNAATIQMKGAVKEDIEELFGTEELAEEFKEKATTLFEAAVSARVIAEVARLEDEFEERLVEEVESITESLTEQVDKYLTHVAEEWVAENEVAIETGIRAELAESFINGMKDLFEQHYVTVPEDRIDAVDALAEQIEELEQALNEQVNANIELAAILEGYGKEDLFDEISEGLAASQVEKFRTLTEGIDYEGDDDKYKRKLEIIREKYFGVKPSSKDVLNEEYEEDEEDHKVYLDESVKHYADIISQSSKK